MTEDSTKQPNPRSLAKLLFLLLGPEEQWDDDKVALALELGGLDSSQSGSRLKQGVDKIIAEKTAQGEEIKLSLLEVQSLLNKRLTAQRERKG
jgi:hypothetical protein